MNSQVLAMFRRSPIGRELGNECMQFNLEMVIAKYQAALPDVVPAILD
jgi:hypothetical protein